MQKNLLKFVFVSLITIFGVASCNTEENHLIENQSYQDVSFFEKSGDPTFHIIYVTWEEFGRTSRSCAGIGLCEALGCAFCCVDNGTIVDCPTNKSREKSGIVKINMDTNRGFLFIPLNPIFEEENDLINNRPNFFIDEAITVSDIIIHEGEYLFDSEVGNHGGYK